MDKFKELGCIFSNQNIHIERGLTEFEIQELEKIYSLEFSNDWKEVYSKFLPIDTGFYNWRDKSEANVLFIKDILAQPYRDILEYYEEIQWNPSWGDEPVNNQHKFLKIAELLEKAPQLIPIYGHRYLPIIEKAPVLSVHNIDIICYGKNLVDYFFIEFGHKRVAGDEYKYVPFWMDDLY